MTAGLGGTFCACRACVTRFTEPHVISRRAGQPIRRAAGPLLAAAAVFCASLSGCVGGSAPRVVRTVQQLSRLSPEAADLGIPVRLRGIITYIDAHGRVYLQQGSRGLEVTINRLAIPLDAGDEIEVTG